METNTAFKNIKIGELCLIYDAKLLKVFLSDRRTVLDSKRIGVRTVLVVIVTYLIVLINDNLRKTDLLIFNRCKLHGRCCGEYRSFNRGFSRLIFCWH